MKNSLIFTIIICLVFSFVSCNTIDETKEVITNIEDNIERESETYLPHTRDLEKKEPNNPLYTPMFEYVLCVDDVLQPRNAFIQKEGIVQITVKKQSFACSDTYDILKIYRNPKDSESIDLLIETFNQLSLKEIDSCDIDQCISYRILYNNGYVINIQHGVANGSFFLKRVVDHHLVIVEKCWEISNLSFDLSNIPQLLFE